MPPLPFALLAALGALLSLRSAAAVPLHWALPAAALVGAVAWRALQSTSPSPPASPAAEPATEPEPAPQTKTKTKTKTETAHETAPETARKTKTLTCIGLAPTTTEADVRAFFDAACGQVTLPTLADGQALGRAFVTFASPAAAAAAAFARDGAPLRGRPVSVVDAVDGAARSRPPSKSVFCSRLPAGATQLAVEAMLAECGAGGGRARVAAPYCRVDFADAAAAARAVAAGAEGLLGGVAVEFDAEPPASAAAAGPRSKWRARRSADWRRDAREHQQQPQQQPPAQQERPEGCTTVYCSNLAADVTKAALADYFAECGRIVSVRMGASRGFCHVEFAPGEAAAAAVDRAVGKSGGYLLGRGIRVEYAAPRASPSATAVRVVGLPPGTTEPLVRRLFATCGEIAAVSGGGAAGFRIAFPTPAGAAKALGFSGRSVSGHEVRVEADIDVEAAAAAAPDEEEELEAPQERPEGCTTVFCRKLPRDITKPILTDFFADCGGDIVSVRFATDRDTGAFRGFGHVEFAPGEGAAAAVDRAVAKTGQVLLGRDMRVDYAAPRPAGGGGRRRGGSRR